MSHRVTCPHCDSALHVLDWATTPSVTCPRCMGRIPNPAFPEVAATARESRTLATAIIADDDVRRDSTSSSLLTTVAPAQNESAAAVIADNDVRRDRSRSGWRLTMLITLAAIGAGSTVLLGLGIAAEATQSIQTALALTVAFIGFGLVVIGALLALAREGVHWAAGVALRLFASIGAAVVAGWALVAVLILIGFALSIAM